MKRLIIMTMILTMLGSNTTMASSNYYVGEAHVIEETEYGYTLEDEEGEAWLVKDLDLEVGDTVSVVWDSMNTTTIYDDEIVRVEKL